MDDQMGFVFSGSGRVVRVDRQTTKTGKTIVSIIVETEGQYPQVLAFKCFREHIAAANALKPGDIVRVKGRLGGRDWQGRVFIDAVAAEITPVGGGAAASEEAPPVDDDSVPF